MLALRFWVRVMLWSGILLLLLVAISLISGQAVAEVVAHLPTWAGLALSLAPFPAGISVAAETFPDGRLVPRRIAEMILAATAVSVLMLTLGNYLAPIAGRALQPQGREFVAEAVHMLLGQLGREAREAAERARATTGTEAIRQWQLSNRLAWHYVRRTDGTVRRRAGSCASHVLVEPTISHNATEHCLEEEPMKKWEYRMIDSADVAGGSFVMGKSRESIEEYLNEIGTEGWEIVNLDFVELENRSSFVGVAKREKR